VGDITWAKRKNYLDNFLPDNTIAGPWRVGMFEHIMQSDAFD
jgi:hypothetical protein